MAERKIEFISHPNGDLEIRGLSEAIMDGDIEFIKEVTEYLNSVLKESKPTHKIYC